MASDRVGVGLRRFEALPDPSDLDGRLGEGRFERSFVCCCDAFLALV